MMKTWIRTVLVVSSMLLISREALAGDDTFLWPEPAPTPAVQTASLWGSPTVNRGQPVPVTPRKAKARAAGTIGAGIAVGSPTGLTGKLRIADAASVDATVAYGPAIYAHSDYLFEGSRLVSSPVVRLSWFAGGGGRLILAQNRSDLQSMSAPATSSTRHAKNPHAGGGGNGNGASSSSSSSTAIGIGARVPVGLELRFRRVKPLEVFGEVALDVGVLGTTGYALQPELGARWYF